LRAAIAVHEDALREHSSLAQAHLNLIQLYGRVENWPKVEEHVQAATTLGFGIADANYNYGVALQAQKKIASAEAAYARAVAANPQHAKAHTALGVLLAERHEHSAALEKFRVAVASDPTYATARYHVGRALVALGRFGEAVAEFERISDSRDDEAPLYLLGLAVAHAGAGQITQAISRAQQAKDLAIARGKYVEVVEPVLRSLQEPRQ
jgi:tetratricopeptide (TPR) repeat protein